MQILSSLSGIQFSAASAGYAPTNSADVSAIASAYATGIGSSEASAIASAYAESAASGKLDSTAFNSGDFYTTANESGFVDTAYVDSALSGKQDSLTFAYDADSAISSINGSALAGGGGGGAGDYVENSSLNVAIGSGNTAYANISFTQGSGNYAEYRSFAQGTQNTASSWSVAFGGTNSAISTGVAFGVNNSAAYTSMAVGRMNYASWDSLAVGVENSASICSVALGKYNTASNTAFSYGYFVSAKDNAFAVGKYNLKGKGDTTTGESAAFVIGNGTSTAARHDLMVVTKDGEITMFSSTADTTGTGILSSIRAISAAATGGIDSATCSAIASAYAESAVSGKQDSLTFTWDSANAISSINGSALAGPESFSEQQLTFLKQALGVDETVLWTGAAIMSNNPSINLSENAMNFRFIDIYSLPHGTNDIPIVTRICVEGLSADADAQGSYTIVGHAGGGGFRINNAYLRIVNYTTITFTEQKQTSLIGSAISTSNAANSIVKIVGVGRIAGN